MQRSWPRPGAPLSEPPPIHELVTATAREGRRRVVIDTTAAFPVSIGLRCVGVLVVRAHAPEHLDASALAVLEQIGVLIAGALSAERDGDDAVTAGRPLNLDIEAFGGSVDDRR